jgi:hypothetical protein
MASRQKMTEARLIEGWVGTHFKIGKTRKASTRRVEDERKAHHV